MTRAIYWKVIVGQPSPPLYGEVPSERGKVLYFLILDVCGYVIYCFLWVESFLNMCYFNYVECKFDITFHLFLYFESLLLFSPPVLSSPNLWPASMIYGMATVFGLRIQGVSGSTDVFRDCLNDMKSHKLSQTNGLENPYLSLCYCGEKTKTKNTHILEGFSFGAICLQVRNTKCPHFSSSDKVYFVKPYSMNVHLVKRRYK